MAAEPERDDEYRPAAERQRPGPGERTGWSVVKTRSEPRLTPRRRHASRTRAGGRPATMLLMLTLLIRIDLQLRRNLRKSNFLYLQCFQSEAFLFISDLL